MLNVNAAQIALAIESGNATELAIAVDGQLNARQSTGENVTVTLEGDRILKLVLWGEVDGAAPGCYATLYGPEDYYGYREEEWLHEVLPAQIVSFLSGNHNQWWVDQLE
jgi:hypothetical protein